MDQAIVYQTAKMFPTPLKPIIYLRKRSRQKDLAIDYLTIQLFTHRKEKSITTKKMYSHFKNKDDLSSFLVQAFNKGSGGEPFKQIRAVYKKGLANMQEISQAHARVHAATLGQFLMAPVKSIEVDAGTMLGSPFHQIGEDDCVSHQITYGEEMSKKGGQYINRVSVLPLDIIKSVIENAYTSKTDDNDDYDNDDNDYGNKNVIHTGK